MLKLALLSLALAATAAADEMWVELGPATTLARYAAREGSTCPAISLDGKTQPMAKRPLAGKFAALVCETPIPDGTKSASINGETLALPHWSKSDRAKIVVIGDTGCRIKQGSDDAASSKSASWNIQNCDNLDAWPFQEVANHAADDKPDLVIHVGDYLYREKSCAGVKDCPGGPAGDTLETWEADFFTPAKKLLRAAPWIFVRGNHESCDRAGDGWFTLLDPRAAKKCADFTDPYLVRAGALPLVVLDNSTASDAVCKPGHKKCEAQFAREVAAYSGYFRKISSWKLDHGWMLLHRPVWALKRGGEGLDVLNAALEASWQRQAPAGIDLLLAGHTHVFEALGFGPGRPMQLVAGNGGTKLAAPMKFDPNSPAVKSAGIREFQKIQDFGFTTLKPDGAVWNIEARDRTGEVKVHCTAPSGGGRCGI